MTQTPTRPEPEDQQTKPATAVVGLQWGDEGKGKVIDILAADHDIVVRYNGGANAGHSIVVGGERFAVHLLPSGVFRDKTESVIANGVVVDAVKLASEIHTLANRGIEVPLGNQNPARGGLWLSNRAHIVTPYHKAQDALTEAWLDEHKTGTPIGTTGRGIGPAYADKAIRAFSIRVGDLLHPEHLRDAIHQCAAWKLPQLEAIQTDRLPLDRSLLDPDAVTQQLLESARTLAPAITDTTHLLLKKIEERKSILFEGANATLLDVDHGTYPFVTSSSTAAAGIAPGTGTPPTNPTHILGVCKAYSTRVGAGPFPTELTNDTAQCIRTRGNEFGTTTGRPRRVGWLDLVALRYAVQINGADSIALMLLDVLEGLETLRLCTAYDTPAGRTTRFTPDARELELATPVFTEMTGFSGDITNARDERELPENARRYIASIEQHAGVPVELISVGPDRDATIRRAAHR